MPIISQTSKMKKLVIVLVAALALCVSANAQKRASVPYAGLSLVSNFGDKLGAGASFGMRNYNRNALVSFGVGGEAYAYLLPSSMQYGIFAVPELGVAIGPKGFKIYPHTGLMFGYDSESSGFHWGGKNGLAFDFGKHFTLDFSTYLPRYNFLSATYAVGLIWRFGK